MPKLLNIARQVVAAAAIFVSGISFATAEDVFRFGVVPQFEAKRLASIWIPILEELHKRTGYRFRMVGSPHIPEFEEAFERGDFEFAYMNPYHAALAAQLQGYQPLVRDGGRALYGVLVVPANSPIQSPSELEGQTIAFPAPNALGASLMMRADLDQRFGIDFEPLYVSTHSSAYLNVVLGKAAAAGGVMATLNKQPEEVRSNLRVLYETRLLAPHPITAHPRVPEEVREAVRKAFLDMGASEEGLAMLAGVPIRKPVVARARDYDVLLEMNLHRYVE